MINAKEKITVYASFLFMGVYCSWLMWMLINNAFIISSPFPIEYREGHSIASTYLLLKGISPFTLDTYPEYYNSYGILNNLLVLPFAWFFGNSLVLHRVINELCIILAILLVIFYKRKPTNWPILLAGVCSFYLFYHINTNISVRPDGLGVFLYISSIIVALRNKFSKKSILICGILSILAFFTKPYYILGWYLVSLVLLFEDWKFFLVSNTFFHLLFLLICIGVNAIFPLYFYETIFAYSSSVGDMNYSLNQMIISIKRLMPLIVVIGVSILIELWRKNYNIIKNIWEWLVIIFAIAFLLLYPLGTNDGAYLTYHTQLLAPILLAMMIDIINEDSIRNIWVQTLIGLCCIYVYIKIPMMHKAEVDGWKKLEKYVDSSESCYNDPGIAPLLIYKDKPVIDDGVSVFVYEFEPRPLTQFLFGKDSLLFEKKKAYINCIAENIREQRYDYAIVSKDKAEKFADYECIDTVEVVYPCNWSYVYYVYQNSETFKLDKSSKESF